MVEPQVVAVARPEVDDLGVREQRDVDRVVRVVVAQEDVGDRLRRDVERRQRVEDQRAAGDHPGVGDDERVAVADEHDAAADAIVGVAGVEEMDGGHGRDATASTPRTVVAAGGMARPRRRRGLRCHPRGPDVADRPADLVLTGGRIATMDTAASLGERPGRPRRPDRGGRRRRGGPAAGRPATRVVELRGRTVTPGFGDAHVHRSAPVWRSCAATSTASVDSIATST